jgi:hypothetical protein
MQLVYTLPSSALTLLVHCMQRVRVHWRRCMLLELVVCCQCAAAALGCIPACLGLACILMYQYCLWANCLCHHACKGQSPTL